MKKLYVVCDGCGDESYDPEGWFELKVYDSSHQCVEEVDLCPGCYRRLRDEWWSDEGEET